jgi:hypothetical protein
MLVHNNAKHRLRKFHTPWICRTSALDKTWADGYRTLAPDKTWADGYNSDDPLYLVQGYCPQIHRMEQKGGRSPAGHVAQFGSCTGDRQDRPPTQGSFQGQYNRPDQHRHPFKAGVQCAACKRIGHEAADCDMLAIALFIDCYTNKKMSDKEKADLENRWLGRWNGQPWYARTHPPTGDAHILRGI